MTQRLEWGREKIKTKQKKKTDKTFDTTTAVERMVKVQKHCLKCRSIVCLRSVGCGTSVSLGYSQSNESVC